MMHGRGKSDPVVVAVKSTNKAGAIRCGADGAKGGDQGERAPTKHALDTGPDKRVTGVGRVRRAAMLGRLDPRWEPYAGKPHVRICAGGAW